MYMEKLPKNSQRYDWALRQMSNPDSGYLLSDISLRLYTEALILRAIKNGLAGRFDIIPKRLRTYRVCLEGARRGICRLRDVPASVVMASNLAFELCRQDARNIYGMPKKLLTEKFLLRLAKEPGYRTLEVLTGYCLENNRKFLVPELAKTILCARNQKTVSGYELNGPVSLDASVLRLLLCVPTRC